MPVSSSQVGVGSVRGSGIPLGTVRCERRVASCLIAVLRMGKEVLKGRAR